MDEQTVAALAAAAALAVVHLHSGKLRFLGGVPRSRWLSAFGGVSVAYVFVHLLPELAEGQQAIEGASHERPLLTFLEDHVYLMALAGLAVFYAVENHSLHSRNERQVQSGEDRTGPGAFWLSMASFAAYNAVIGYLLLRGELEQPAALALYALALGLHFIVNDFGLSEHHKNAYQRVGRWVIAVAVLAGWLVGVVAELSERLIGLVVAFIAGGVVLNVMKEELPAVRHARVLPFLAGAVGYGLLLQLA